MKKFEDLRKKHISEDGDQAYGSIYRNTGPGGDNAVDTPDVAVFDVGHPDTVRRLNAYLSSATAKPAIDPYSILRQVHRKLSLVGFQFLLPSNTLNSKFPGNRYKQENIKPVNVGSHTPSNPNNWRETYSLSYLGGRYGYLNYEGEIGYDDNIRHRLGHGLTLEVEYTIQPSGLVFVSPKIVAAGPTNEGFISTTKNIYRGLTSPLDDPRRKFLQQKRRIRLNNMNKHYKQKFSVARLGYKTARNTLSGVSKLAAGVASLGGAAAYHGVKDVVPVAAKAGYKVAKGIAKGGYAASKAFAKGATKAAPIARKAIRSAGRTIGNGARAVGRSIKSGIQKFRQYIAARRAASANARATNKPTISHLAAVPTAGISHKVKPKVPNANAVARQSVNLLRNKIKSAKPKSAPTKTSSKPKPSPVATKTPTTKGVSTAAAIKTVKAKVASKPKSKPKQAQPTKSASQPKKATNLLTKKTP